MFELLNEMCMPTRCFMYIIKLFGYCKAAPHEFIIRTGLP